MADVTEIAVTCAGRPLTVSARTRLGPADLIVLAHGFGCAKEVYSDAFQAPELAGFALCAFDFPSHGQSGRVDPDESTMDNFADVLSRVVRALPHHRLFLVCHSMGGAAGLLATRYRLRPDCFINVEGNLVAEDCGIVSRGTAIQERHEFTEHGYAELRASLRASARPDLTRWEGWLGQCQPASLHAVARSLVAWSDDGSLGTIFRRLTCRHYIKGSLSELGHLEPTLLDIPVHTIPGSGHFPMLDNPTGFYAVVGDIVSAGIDASPEAVSATSSRRPRVGRPRAGMPGPAGSR